MSEVWKFFEKDTPEAGKASCTFCGLIFKHNQSTSTLRRHLQNKRCKKLPTDFVFDGGAAQKRQRRIEDLQFNTQLTESEAQEATAELWADPYDVRELYSN